MHYGVSINTTILSTATTNASLVFAYGSQRPIPVIPCAEIAKVPGQYYDTTKFTLPAPLNVSKSERGGLYALAEYLAGLSRMATPFQFRSAYPQR
jgi:hypothetical protein